MSALPPLRAVDAVTAEHDGQPVVVLNDPEGYAAEQVALSGPAFFIAAQLNGKHGIRDIQTLFARQFGGAIVASEQIGEIVRFLDEQGFLLSGRFDERRNQIDGAFRRAASRPASLAGRSYPSSPAELRTFLDEFLILPGEPLPSPPDSEAPLPALIVPHIDFQRGGACYGAGYRRLAAYGMPDTVIVLGVAHASPPVPFALASKTFETPLGDLTPNLEILDRLSKACAWDPFEYETVHRTEHSIEFQAVMLARLYGSRVRIVPMLCSQLDLDDPDEAEAIRRFLDAIRQETLREGSRITVVAGADLAHVGKRFGDPFGINDAVIQMIRRRDEEDLAFVTAPNPARFYRSVMKDENARRVCGLSCIYAALHGADGRAATGELLHYGYAHDPAGGIVSFAAIALA